MSIRTQLHLRNIMETTFGETERERFEKLRGANLKYKQDGALKLFTQLRDRMYARILHYEGAPESQRQKLIPTTALQFGEWEGNTRQARWDYI